jgi:nucleoside-diphosphate-sugar epimerase
LVFSSSARRHPRQGVISVVAACRNASVPVLVLTSSPSTKMDGSDICNLREDQLKVPAPDQCLQEYSRTKALGEAYALAQHSAAKGGLRVCAIGPHQVSCRQLVSHAVYDLGRCVFTL